MNSKTTKPRNFIVRALKPKTKGKSQKQPDYMFLSRKQNKNKNKKQNYRYHQTERSDFRIFFNNMKNKIRQPHVFRCLVIPNYFFRPIMAFEFIFVCVCAHMFSHLGYGPRRS